MSDADKLPVMVINGKKYPTIDERHTLWVKRLLDPEWYSPEFLSTIWIGRVPQPERPPEFWLREMFKNQGIML